MQTEGLGAFVEIFEADLQTFKSINIDKTVSGCYNKSVGYAVTFAYKREKIKSGDL